VTVLGNTHRKAALLLTLVALILPYEIEFEVSGPLDARIFRTLISSTIWAIETNGYQSMIGSSETSQFLFPICCLTINAVVLLLINLLLIILIFLCLDGIISRHITAYALILSVILPIIVSCIVSIFLVMVTSLLLPIPVVQLSGLLVLWREKSTSQNE
jgi:hypothetical protein